MERRKFTRDFKVEAVRLVRERGGSAAQAARDLDGHANVLDRQFTAERPNQRWGADFT